AVGREHDGPPFPSLASSVMCFKVVLAVVVCMLTPSGCVNHPHYPYSRSISRGVGVVSPLCDGTPGVLGFRPRRTVERTEATAWAGRYRCSSVIDCGSCASPRG